MWFVLAPSLLKFSSWNSLIKLSHDPSRWNWFSLLSFTIINLRGLMLPGASDWLTWFQLLIFISIKLFTVLTWKVLLPLGLNLISSDGFVVKAIFFFLKPTKFLVCKQILPTRIPGQWCFLEPLSKHYFLSLFVCPPPLGEGGSLMWYLRNDPQKPSHQMPNSQEATVVDMTYHRSVPRPHPPTNNFWLIIQSVRSTKADPFLEDKRHICLPCWL